MRPTLQLPAEDSEAGTFARQLATLLGTALQAAPGSVVEAHLLALGQALADGRATNLAALDEAFPDTAAALLAEWEASYGLTPRADLSTAARRDRLVAKVRAARAGTPAGILTALRTLAPEATITETTATAVAATDPRNVFVFAVVLGTASWADTDLRAALVQILEQMKPAHTTYRLTTRVGFRCDDADSLCDRDLLGS